MPCKEEKLLWLHLLDRKSQTGNSSGGVFSCKSMENPLLTSLFLLLLEPKSSGGCWGPPPTSNNGLSHTSSFWKLDSWQRRNVALWDMKNTWHCRLQRIYTDVCWGRKGWTTASHNTYHNEFLRFNLCFVNWPYVSAVKTWNSQSCFWLLLSQKFMAMWNCFVSAAVLKHCSRNIYSQRKDECLQCSLCTKHGDF